MFLILLTIFKPAFRWQVQEAIQVYQEQGAAFLPVTLEISRGIPNSEKKFPWHYVTRGNSIWRPLITCASVRWRAWRNTLPRIRLFSTENSCLTEACAFMPWWQTRAAPVLWTCSCATLWSPLLVFMMAGKEIHCPWQTWVAPSTSHLKAGLNIVIIYPKFCRLF